MYSSLKNTVLELLFPQECIGCGKPETALCSVCMTRITHPELNCFSCGARNERGTFCVSCKHSFPWLTRLLVGSTYHNPIVKESVTRFKYASEHALASPLSTVMVSPFKKALQGVTPPDKERMRIVPVPLHKKRLRMRGYNQSELLAKEISRETDIPLLPKTTLTRIKHTTPQVSLLKEHRGENVSGAFAVSDASLVKKSTVILVDDVATTGSTLVEAARILKQNGARDVWGLVVAKG
jgi:competence protein ComFC